MGRLAIIEEDGGGKPPEPPPKEQVVDSSTSTSSASSMTASSAKTEAAATSSTSRMKQGGISDESGYYEGDELRDDSIEIVYDRYNKTRNTATPSNANTASSSVSITPLVNSAPQQSNGKSRVIRKWTKGIT